MFLVQDRDGGNVLCVDAAVLAALQVHDARADVLILALAGLALAVEVPDRLGEGLQHVWAFDGEGVVNVMRGYDVRFAALEGLGDAKETNDIGVVDVEELASASVSGGFRSLVLSRQPYRAFVR